MKKVVLVAKRICDEDAFYTTEELQDEWSVSYVGCYTMELEKAKVFNSLREAFNYVKMLRNVGDMLVIEPMWLVEEAVMIGVTQVLESIL